MYFLKKLNQKSLGLRETQTVRSKVNTSHCGEILLTTPPPILLRGVSRNQTDSSGTTLKWQLTVTCGVTHPELPAPNPKHPRILSKQQPYQERKKILKNWQYLRASLVAQWIRIYLPMWEMRVWPLVWEDFTCCRPTKPVNLTLEHVL